MVPVPCGSCSLRFLFLAVLVYHVLYQNAPMTVKLIFTLDVPVNMFMFIIHWFKFKYKKREMREIDNLMTSLSSLPRTVVIAEIIHSMRQC